MVASQERCRPSVFLTVLFDGAELTEDAQCAFDMLVLAEERAIAFAGSEVGADRSWQTLLLLHIAEAGGFQLATDIMELIDLGDDRTIDQLFLQLEREQFIRIDAAFLVLTAAGDRKLRMTLDAVQRTRRTCASDLARRKLLAVEKIERQLSVDRWHCETTVVQDHQKLGEKGGGTGLPVHLS